MRSELIEAITHLKKFPDYVERPQFKMSGEDIRKIEVATKLQMPADLKDVYRELGRFAVTETELYFRATYSSGEEVVGEIQILFNRIDQILDFHETLVVSRDNPNRLEPKYLVFGTADGGNSFLMVDGTEDEGAVYFWPLAFDPIGEGDNEQGVAKVSGSLPDFIAGLRTIDEI